MKTKPRWMKSVIATAEQYALSVSARDQKITAKATPRPNRSDEA